MTAPAWEEHEPARHQVMLVITITGDPAYQPTPVLKSFPGLRVFLDNQAGHHLYTIYFKHVAHVQIGVRCHAQNAPPWFALLMVMAATY